MAWSLRQLFIRARANVAEKVTAPAIGDEKAAPEIKASDEQMLYDQKRAALNKLISQPYFTESVAHDNDGGQNWALREKTILIKDANGNKQTQRVPYIALGLAAYTINTNAQGENLPTEVSTSISDIVVTFDPHERNYRIERLVFNTKETNKKGIKGDLSARVEESIQCDLAGKSISQRNSDASQFQTNSSFVKVSRLNYVPSEPRDEEAINESLKTIAHMAFRLSLAAENGDSNWFDIKGKYVTYIPKEVPANKRANKERAEQKRYEAKLDALNSFIVSAHIQGKDGDKATIPEEIYKYWAIRERTLRYTRGDGKHIESKEPYIALGCASVELMKEGNKNGRPTTATSVVNDFIVTYDPITQKYMTGVARNSVKETDHNGITSDYRERAKRCASELWMDCEPLDNSPTSHFENGFQIIGMGELNQRGVAKNEDPFDTAFHKLAEHLKILDGYVRSGMYHDKPIFGGQYFRYIPKELKFPDRVPEHLRPRGIYNDKAILRRER